MVFGGLGLVVCGSVWVCELIVWVCELVHESQSGSVSGCIFL